jgi:chemotaxis protein MotB
MAKKKEQPAEEGSPAWMSTFSDLMNLLLCFFVLLFASSNVDVEKIQRIMASFNNASFSVLESGSIALDEGQVVSGGVTQLPGIESFLEYIGVSSEVKGDNQELSATGADEGTDEDSSEPDSVEPNTEEVLSEDTSAVAGEEKEISAKELKEQLEEQGLEQSEEMYDEISDMTESYSIDDMVSLDFNSQYVSMDLNGAILFDGGQADIREDAKPFMKKIASILGKYKSCIIEIEGHTDNIPISSSIYPSNRYLSTARATKVYEYIMEQTNLPDENIKIAGYGESRPVASNSTEEGRAKNRRVSIKIYNQLNSDTETSIE